MPVRSQLQMRRVRATAHAPAAPSDWFRLMGHEGWTQEELAADGLRHSAANNKTGGQFLDYFLRRAVAGERDLARTRRHLIASSALYHAGALRDAQVHYGLDDGIVPVRSGLMLAARYPEAVAAGRLELVVHEGGGHDQDLFDAPRQSRDHLRRRLLPGAMQ